MCKSGIKCNSHHILKLKITHLYIMYKFGKARFWTAQKVCSWTEQTFWAKRKWKVTLMLATYSRLMKGRRMCVCSVSRSLSFDSKAQPIHNHQGLLIKKSDVTGCNQSLLGSFPGFPGFLSPVNRITMKLSSSRFLNIRRWRFSQNHLVIRMPEYPYLFSFFSWLICYIFVKVNYGQQEFKSIRAAY